MASNLKLLFLDDIRQPYDMTWDLVKDYKAFVRYIEEYGVPDVISFDHDLAMEHYIDPTTPYQEYEEKTGYDCAKYLVEKKTFPMLVIIHSFNPVGAQNIYNVLHEHCKTVVKPFRYEIILSNIED